MKEGEGVSQRTYMHDTQTQTSVGKARKKGSWVEAGWRWVKGGGGGNRNIFNSVNKVSFL